VRIAVCGLRNRPDDEVDWTKQRRVTSDTSLDKSNVGYQLLMKIGWKGGGLGRGASGRVDPVPLGAENAKMGLGMLDEYVFIW
jgi:hypothetical protein